MRGMIFRVLGLTAGVMLLVGLGISANASAHMFRSVPGSTGIHHEATGERTETPEPSDTPEATKSPTAAEPADTDVEAGPGEVGDNQSEDTKAASQTETKSKASDKGGSGGSDSGGGD